MLALTIIVRYVFLDRDGVLNRKMPEGVYVAEWAQFAWLPGAVEAVARMKRAGLTVIVVSNQRGIALGRITTMQLEGLPKRCRNEWARKRSAARRDLLTARTTTGSATVVKPDTGLFEQAFPKVSPSHAGTAWSSVILFPTFRPAGGWTLKNHLHPGRAGSPEGGADAAATLADAVAGLSTAGGRGATWSHRAQREEQLRWNRPRAFVPDKPSVRDAPLAGAEVSA